MVSFTFTWSIWSFHRVSFIVPVSSLMVALATLSTTSLYLDKTSRGLVFSVTLASMSTRLVPSLRSFIFKKNSLLFCAVSFPLLFLGAVSACVSFVLVAEIEPVKLEPLKLVGKSRVCVFGSFRTKLRLREHDNEGYKLCYVGVFAGLGLVCVVKFL